MKLAPVAPAGAPSGHPDRPQRGGAVQLHVLGPPAPAPQRARRAVLGTERAAPPHQGLSSTSIVNRTSINQSLSLLPDANIVVGMALRRVQSQIASSNHGAVLRQVVPQMCSKHGACHCTLAGVQSGKEVLTQRGLRQVWADM